MDNPFKSPVILSFCPGILGLERGLERAIGSFTVAAYVEIEAFIIQNLVAAMEEGVLAPAPIWTDVKTFNAAIFRNKIHGIIGGYPCQPFSNSGLRKGKDDPRHLWPSIKKCIKKSRPVWCFFENVEGHLSLGFDIVQKDLHKLGYSVEAGLFSAEEVGAPHRRNRLFILAVENSFIQRMRGGNNEQGENRECEIQAKRSSELGHPNSGNKSGEWSNKSEEGVKTSGSSFKMANSDSFGEGGLSECEQRQEREEQIDRNDIDWNGEELADTRNPGLEGIRTRESSSRKKFPLPSCCSDNQWPARPGEEQYTWEEPRTIKSGLGITIDGYNFREDLLRAAGNAVVEQSGEVAFNNLLRKHLKN